MFRVERVLEMFTRLRFLSVLPGLALTFIQENSFKPESGSRPGIPKIGVFITDGKSQDDVIPPAQRLRDAGIEVFAIGTLTGFTGGEGEQRRSLGSLHPEWDPVHPV